MDEILQKLARINDNLTAIAQDQQLIYYLLLQMAGVDLDGLDGTPAPHA